MRRRVGARAMSSPRDPNTFLRVYRAPGSVENYFLSKLEGEEWLSKPFHFTLTIRTQGDIPEKGDWLGAPITFGMGASDGTLRKINGQCTRFEQSYHKQTYIEFVVDVEPQFVQAKQRRDCRIFTDQTALDVITTIFAEYNLAFDQSKVNFVDDVRQYCVQYWETDYDFCCRLMEEEGIFYFFKYDEGAGQFEHRMYLADDSSAYFDGDIFDITFREDEKHQGLIEIDLQFMQTTSAWMTHDYNFKKPNSLTPIKTSTNVDYATKNTKFYEWPGGYDNPDSGERRSKFGIQLAEAASVLMSGSGTYMCFLPAARFSITDKRLTPGERQIAIRSVNHTSHNPYSAEEGEFIYAQTFTAIPSFDPYHPPRITPRAVVRGPQTAVVLDQVDPEGFGRIKVRFHWDHLATSTCWLRVAQQWAGDQIGAQWIPRVGMEVMVAFLEGDPDRPLVTGCLYNGDNKHPFDVPPHLSQAGWRTRSYPSGSVTNEFIFEDKAGGEEIYTYAGRNYRRQVIKDEDVDIGEYRRTKIGKDETREVVGQRSTKIDKDELLEVGGQQTSKIAKDQTTKVGGKSETTVADNAHLKVDGGLWVEVANDIKIDSSSATRMVTTGSFTLESKTELVFMVGGSRIEITAAGITIKAPVVKIN